MRRRQVRSFATLSLVACALTLTSCRFEVPLGNGGAALADSIEGLRVALCQDVTIERLVLSERTADSDETDIWVATGRVEAKAGDVLTAETIARDFDSSQLGEPALAPGSRVTLFVEGSTEGSSLLLGFDIGTSGLSASQWFHTNEMLTDEPCPPD
jgi:hypothetical protein